MEQQIKARIAATEAEFAAGQTESEQLDEHETLLIEELKRVRVAQVQLQRKLDMLYGSCQTLRELAKAALVDAPDVAG